MNVYNILLKNKKYQLFNNLCKHFVDNTEDKQLL